MAATEWADHLMAATECADPVRDAWPRLTAAILVAWHEVDRFEWRDVVAGIRVVVSSGAGPPGSWKYFSKAIARAKRDRTTKTPEAESHERHNDNRPERGAGRSTDYLRVALDLDNERRNLDLDRASGF